jgi:hypothetical protein
MQTINETILTTVVNTMVERNKALEVQLAAAYEELAESRREFNIVEGALDFWHDESDRKQGLIVRHLADLKLARTVISEYNKFYDRKEGLNQ